MTYPTSSLDSNEQQHNNEAARHVINAESIHVNVGVPKCARVHEVDHYADV